MDDEQHLCALVSLGRETRDLDFKGPASWDPKSDKGTCCAVVKDVLAMANTHGGTIVVGVEELDGGFKPVGLPPAQLSSWESTKVNNFIQSYADPPVNVEIAKPICQGKQFAVLLVPQFRQTPHLCIKDYPGELSKPTLYVRSANNASEALASAQDFQDLIEHAIRTRADQMLESMRAILVGADVQPRLSDLEEFSQQMESIQESYTAPYPDQGYDGYFTTAMFPARFDQRRFTIEQLRQAAEAASVTYRGWPYLYYALGDRDILVMNDGLKYEHKAPHGFGGTDVYFGWVLKQSGLLVTRALLWEEDASVRAQHGRVIDPNTIIFSVTEAVAALIRYYESLGVQDEDITLRITLEGVRDRALAAVDPGRFIGGQFVAHEPAIVIEASQPLSDWSAGLRERSTELAIEILQRFQVRGGFEVREWVDRLLDRRL